MDLKKKKNTRKRMQQRDIFISSEEKVLTVKDKRGR